jgi:transcriptional regulator with XRE-family HTH domain
VVNQKIGKIAKMLRGKNDLTLKALSRMTGISIGMLGDIESGKTNPSVNNLGKLASALHVTPGQLLGTEKIDLIQDEEDSAVGFAKEGGINEKTLKRIVKEEVDKILKER